MIEEYLNKLSRFIREHRYDTDISEVSIFPCPNDINKSYIVIDKGTSNPLDFRKVVLPLTFNNHKHYELMARTIYKEFEDGQVIAQSSSSPQSANKERAKI